MRECHPYQDHHHKPVPEELTMQDYSHCFLDFRNLHLPNYLDLWLDFDLGYYKQSKDL